MSGERSKTVDLRRASCGVLSCGWASPGRGAALGPGPGAGLSGALFNGRGGRAVNLKRSALYADTLVALSRDGCAIVTQQDDLIRVAADPLSS